MTVSLGVAPNDPLHMCDNQSDKWNTTTTTTIGKEIDMIPTDQTVDSDSDTGNHHHHHHRDRTAAKKAKSSRLIEPPPWYTESSFYEVNSI